MVDSFTASLLNRKYGILGQQADAATLDAQAKARLEAAQTAGVEAQSKANLLAQVQGASSTVSSGVTLDPVGDQLRLAQAHLALTQGAGIRSETDIQNDVNRRQQGLYDQGLASGQFGTEGATGKYNVEIDRMHATGQISDAMWKAARGGYGLRMGTARVPGKGDGTKDTVKAKLAPGEAVLNKGAAEHLGRGLIAALNKHGAAKMGMV